MRHSTANERIRQFFLEVIQELSVFKILFLNFSANMASRLAKLLVTDTVTETTRGKVQDSSIKKGNYKAKLI